MKTQNLSTLTIHKMSREQFDREKAAGRINDNEIYLTPDEGGNSVGSLTDLGVTATAAELNILDGVTATTTEINYVDGVTSNIQTQLNNKVPTSRTVNGKALSANITLTKGDINLGNVENKSSATIRGELTKANVTTALGYTPPMQDTTYSAITNDEIDEICSSTISTYLESIASEGVSF